jgi:hypothetical protein
LRHINFWLNCQNPKFYPNWSNYRLNKNNNFILLKITFYEEIEKLFYRLNYLYRRTNNLKIENWSFSYNFSSAMFNFIGFSHFWKLNFYGIRIEKHLNFVELKIYNIWKWWSRQMGEHQENMDKLFPSSSICWWFFTLEKLCFEIFLMLFPRWHNNIILSNINHILGLWRMMHFPFVILKYLTVFYSFLLLRIQGFKMKSCTLKSFDLNNLNFKEITNSKIKWKKSQCFHII